MADDKPIIIIKKKGGHGGHHGGAWKVAYADFVTAMMAFFMVMWLVNTASSVTRENIASYFRKPGIFESGSGTPLGIGEAGILPDSPPPKPDEKKKSMGNTQSFLKRKSGTDSDNGKKRITERGEKEKGQGDKAGVGENTPEKEEQFEKETYKSYGLKLLEDSDVTAIKAAGEEIKGEIENSGALQKMLGVVDVKVDADGLNIEIMDTSKTSMFLMSSARIQPEAEAAFRRIGAIMAKLPNNIDIIGHTDSIGFPESAVGYSNWELSSDRANAARRILVSTGVAPERIKSVVGRADRELKVPSDPESPSNRRITLKMRFREFSEVDLSKDPSAIDHVDFEEEKFLEGKADEARALAEKNKPFVPEAIIEAPKPKTIQLPEDPSNPSEEVKKKKNLIFGDSPVFGPGDNFANY